MTKKVSTLLCMAAVALGIGTASQAQDRHLYHSVYLNGNIPTGQFAKSISSDADVPLTAEYMGKDASIGFGAGYRASYHFDVGLGEVAPYVNADFLWNTIAGKWSDKYSDKYYSTPTYFNIPVQIGVTYIYDELPWPSIRAFGEFGIGTDLLWITSEGKGDGNERYAYKANFAFAWSIGAGAYFGQYFSVGLHYYGMGTHNIDYTSGTIDDNTNAALRDAAIHNGTISRDKRSVGSVMLRLGFTF